MKGIFKISVFVVIVGVVSTEPPPQQNQGGWGQQQQAVQPIVQQDQGWGQQQAPQQQAWSQPQPQQQMSGWSQPQQMAGWSQDGGSGGGKGGKTWEYNFALGYQGDKGKGGGGGWGTAPAASSGWGPDASGGGGGGWSSEPETNIKKPSIGEFFSAILSFPREIKNILKDSGLWILFLPLLIIVPLFIFAFSAGKFFGGLDEGWGWERSSSLKTSWLEREWGSISGFITDKKVQKAAKGFLDEFVANRIVTSVKEEVKPVVNKINTASKNKVVRRR